MFRSVISEVQRLEDEFREEIKDAIGRQYETKIFDEVLSHERSLQHGYEHAEQEMRNINQEIIDLNNIIDGNTVNPILESIKEIVNSI